MKLEQLTGVLDIHGNSITPSFPQLSQTDLPTLVGYARKAVRELHMPALEEKYLQKLENKHRELDEAARERCRKLLADLINDMHWQMQELCHVSRLQKGVHASQERDTVIKDMRTTQAKRNKTHRHVLHLQEYNDDQHVKHVKETEEHLAKLDAQLLELADQLGAWDEKERNIGRRKENTQQSLHHIVQNFQSSLSKILSGLSDDIQHDPVRRRRNKKQPPRLTLEEFERRLFGPPHHSHAGQPRAPIVGKTNHVRPKTSHPSIAGVEVVQTAPVAIQTIVGGPRQTS